MRKVESQFAIHERLRSLINQRDHLISRRAGYLAGRRRVRPPGNGLRAGEVDQFISKLNEHIRLVESSIKGTIRSDANLYRLYLEISSLQGHGLIRTSRVLVIWTSKVGGGRQLKSAA